MCLPVEGRPGSPFLNVLPTPEPRAHMSGLFRSHTGAGLQATQRPEASRSVGLTVQVCFAAKNIMWVCLYWVHVPGV